MINEELKKYIEEKVFPIYKNNERGHNIDHIMYVINRSLKFAKTIDNINYNMVFTIAAYHDIGHYIDAKNHEKISSEILLNDNNLKRFFTEEEIKIMAEAVCDHRASKNEEPRSIYGKIVSSADRNTIVNEAIKRTYYYRLKHSPEKSLEEIIEESRHHLLEKFGKNGYATEKMYFVDEDYILFLDNITELTSNKEIFRDYYLSIINLESLHNKQNKM